MKIGRYERYSDGNFHLAETMTTDSPYWRIENGQIFYIIWDVIRSVYVERKKIKMKMSEQEAIADNCGCYYKVLEQRKAVRGNENHNRNTRHNTLCIF